MFDLKTVLLVFLPITGIAVLTTDAGVLSADRIPTIIKREEWGAKKTDKVARKLSESPAPYVIIRDTSTDACTTKTTCGKLMQDIQDTDIEGRECIDIRYNFCVDEDGNVYEGRGWDASGAHTEFFNLNSIGICVLGKFHDRVPTNAALEAIKDLITFGVSLEKISSSYRIYTYHQVIPFPENTGGNLTQLIKSWPHGGEYTE